MTSAARLATLWASVLFLFASSGCGTIHTRWGQHKFGAYPYQGAAVDVVGVFDSEGVYYTLPSLPFDLAVDTVCLPVDLIWWMCGIEKDHSHSWQDCLDDRVSPPAPWNPQTNAPPVAGGAR